MHKDDISEPIECLNSFGRPLTTLTDHKPLISISKKALVNELSSLQRLLLRLNNYNATLMLISGKEMIFSDHLSRNVFASTKPSEPTCKGLELKVEDIYLNTSNDRCMSLASETDKDENLVALKAQIIKGWPKHRDECPGGLMDFWSFGDELSIFN